MISNAMSLELNPCLQLNQQQQQAPMLQLLAEIEHLPVLPENVQQILRLLNDRNCSFEKLAAVLATDQALAADVMRLVNSGLYGYRCRISSLRQAMTILGIYGIRSLILSSAVLQLLQSSQPALFQHALLCSRAAAGVAREVNYAPVDDAVTAGLLHDVGLLILLDYLPDKYRQVQARMRADAGCTQLAAEQAVLGMSHAGLGAELLALWKLPAPLVAAVAGHHGVDGTVEASRLTAVIAVADWIARTLAPLPSLPTATALDAGVLQILDLEPDDVQQISQSLIADLKAGE